MKINVTGKKITLRNSFAELAEKKLAKISKFFDEEAVCNVAVRLEKDSEIVEVTVKNNGIIFRAENTSSDMETALDNAVNALVRQIHKNKTKLAKRLRSAAPANYDFAPEIEEETDFDIVRHKKFIVKPITIDEAILQMNMLGHQFYVFKNADTDAVNVVYKRKNDSYGLIEPEDE